MNNLIISIYTFQSWNFEVGLDTFRKWLKLNKIANQDLSSSSENILLAIRDSIELIDVKLKLEKNLNDLN